MEFAMTRLVISQLKRDTASLQNETYFMRYIICAKKVIEYIFSTGRYTLQVTLTYYKPHQVTDPIDMNIEMRHKFYKEVITILCELILYIDCDRHTHGGTHIKGFSSFELSQLIKGL